METEQVLAELFARNKRMLLKLIRVRLSARILSRVDPADVLQEVFVEALNG